MHHVRDLGIGSQVPFVYPPILDAAAAIYFSTLNALLGRFTWQTVPIVVFRAIPWFFGNQMVPE
jgi:hypothetical protein